MNAVQRVAKNSLVPMAAQAVNKVADVAFAIYVFRVLGSEGAGRYAFAIVTWLYIKTISDFGLGVLAAREVARRPEAAGAWLGGGATVRLLGLLGLLPVVAALLAAYGAAGRLADDTALAVGLLVLSIAPGALRRRRHRHLQRARADGDAGPGDGAEHRAQDRGRRSGAGGRRRGGRPRRRRGGWSISSPPACCGRWSGRWRRTIVWWPGLATVRHWLIVAWPLLLNGLLIGLFFRLDTYVIQAARGDAELGLYDAAYRFINVALLLPPYVTMALFPTFARQAERDPAALRRTLRQAIGYLLILALPAAVATTTLSDWLIWLLAGPAFLPGSSEALRVLIWFLPFSYVNGLVQYALIALDRQRVITGAFALTVAFNLGANLLLVPSFGLHGAAAVTVLSEIVLLAPLLSATRRALGPLGLAAVAWRPVAAAAVMAAVVILAGGLGPWPATLLGGAAYLATLLALGAWGAEERRLARALLGR